MNVLLYLIPLALLLGLLAFGGFIWTIRNSQYDDLEGTSRRILLDEEDQE